MKRVLLCGLWVSLCTGSAIGDTWNEPHPWRREALIEGRDFNYNTDSFLNRFSYRHLSISPRAGEDGLRGTAGSVTGDELFVDMAFQKTLGFDDQRHAIFLRVQRTEDFDGEFDRQLVGIARRLGQHWQIALAGDIKGSKAETDIQFEGRWQPDEHRLLRLAWILPEYFYNDKSDNEGEYSKRPQTWFVHYREERSSGGKLELALNYSPEAGFDDREQGVDARGDQARLMGTITIPFQQWRASMRLEAEWTDREFTYSVIPSPPEDSFKRRMHSVTVSVHADHWRYNPEFGIRHFRLKEDGWFGADRNITGAVRRDETLLFASARYQTGERHYWQPAIYFGPAQLSRRAIEDPGFNREEDKWIGKLALPWRYVMSTESNAVLTINPTLDLHSGAFGGGNIQLHWPF